MRKISYPIAFLSSIIIVLIGLLMTKYYWNLRFIVLIAFLVFPILKLLGLLEERATGDFLKIAIMSFVFLASIFLFNLINLHPLEWSQIIMFGIVADILIFTLRLVPKYGEMAASLIIFIIITTLVKDSTGILYGSVASIVALIPINKFPLVSISMISLKLMTDFLGSMMGGII